MLKYSLQRHESDKQCFYSCKVQKLQTITFIPGQYLQLNRRVSVKKKKALGMLQYFESILVDYCHSHFSVVS
jgi:hypothetical protein